MIIKTSGQTVVTNQQIAIWVRMRNQPRPVAYDTIGRYWGVSGETVRRHVKDKVPKASAKMKGYRRKVDPAVVVELEAAGMRRVDIARAYGVSRSAITYAAQRAA